MSHGSLFLDRSIEGEGKNNRERKRNLKLERKAKK